MELLIFILFVCSVAISFIFYRARQNSKVVAYWIPFFTIALVWTFKSVMIDSVVPIILLNFPFVLLLVGLLISFPKNETWQSNTIIIGIGATFLIFTTAHFVLKRSVAIDVMDQHKNPVADVSIKYRLGTTQAFFPFERSGYTYTDSKGRANIQYYLFHNLAVGPVDTSAKERYLFIHEREINHYHLINLTIPTIYRQHELVDRITPILIRARKIDPDVLTGDGNTEFDPESQTATIYLPEPGPTIAIRHSIMPKSIPNQPDEDWSYELKLPKGGLQLADGIYMQEAMKEGYQPSIRKKLVLNKKPGWFYSEATYFFKTSDGLYGKLAISLLCESVEKICRHVNYFYWINNEGRQSLVTNELPILGYPNKNNRGQTTIK